MQYAYYITRWTSRNMFSCGKKWFFLNVNFGKFEPENAGKIQRKIRKYSPKRRKEGRASELVTMGGGGRGTHRPTQLFPIYIYIYIYMDIYGYIRHSILMILLERGSPPACCLECGLPGVGPSFRPLLRQASVFSTLEATIDCGLTRLVGGGIEPGFQFRPGLLNHRTIHTSVYFSRPVTWEPTNQWVSECVLYIHSSQAKCPEVSSLPLYHWSTHGIAVVGFWSWDGMHEFGMVQSSQVVHSSILYVSLSCRIILLKSSFVC